MLEELFVNVAWIFYDFEHILEEVLVGFRHRIFEYFQNSRAQRSRVIANITSAVAGTRLCRAKDTF